MAAPAYLLKVLGLHSCLPSWENWDNSPHKPSKFYDGLLVSNHIQGVVLDTDNIQLVTLLQGGAVGGHQAAGSKMSLGWTGMGLVRGRVEEDEVSDLGE